MGETMKAAVFKGPLDIVVEDRPIPKIQYPTDIIVKVQYAGLCGSDLHFFRGVEYTHKDVIQGHEIAGHVHEVGSDVKGFQIGDLIVSPFTISCGACFYCKRGYSGRCDHCELYGYSLDGGQAQYVRIPRADTTVFKAPEGVSNESLVIMGDIFPTGYFATNNGFKQMDLDEVPEATVVVIGCGPVGLCALINAEDRHPKNLIAIDSIPARLNLAKSLGAEPWNYLTESDALKKRIKELTNGRGADIVIEVVGNKAALRMGFDLLRPWGILSSVGAHSQEVPFTSTEAYDKNLRIQMGRCPVRSIFQEALSVFQRKQHLLGFMSEKIMPLTQAKEAYDIFNRMEVQKVIFDAQR